MSKSVNNGSNVHFLGVLSKYVVTDGDRRLDEETHRTGTEEEGEPHRRLLRSTDGRSK